MTPHMPRAEQLVKHPLKSPVYVLSKFKVAVELTPGPKSAFGVIKVVVEVVVNFVVVVVVVLVVVVLVVVVLVVVVVVVVVVVEVVVGTIFN